MYLSCRLHWNPWDIRKVSDISPSKLIVGDLARKHRFWIREIWLTIKCFNIILTPRDQFRLQRTGYTFLHPSPWLFINSLLISRSNRLNIMPKASQEYNFYILKPSLVKEWHPTKNVEIKPYDVTPGSGKKVWWICQKGHEWQAVIYSRSRGSGCPYCNKLKSADDGSLVVSNSSLRLEWHPTANGKLTPLSLALNYPEKVWWICREGHEWKATVKVRIPRSSIL